MTVLLQEPCWEPSCTKNALYRVTMGDNTFKACGSHLAWFPVRTDLSQLKTLVYRTTETESGYDWSGPPSTAIFLDENHAIVKLWWPDENDTWVGIDEWHRKSDGKWCVGYCLFDVPDANEWAHAYVGDMKTRWTVTYEPLTMSPSVACKVCPSHGFIREGKWVGA